MSTATLVVALAAAPVGAQVDGREALEAFAATVGRDPVNVLLRCTANSAVAKAFAVKQPGDVLLASGSLTLDDDNNVPQLAAFVLCDATRDQYVNEVTLVGRLTNEPKVSESGKSATRTLAVNRFVADKEHTDWFKLRGYGAAKDRLEKAGKGALVSINGTLEQRTNREGNPYCEIKVRVLRLHSNSKSGGASSGPAAGSTAVGYAHEDFTEPDGLSCPDMPAIW